MIAFRHKRGYGVHSPFVFELITGLINENAGYYAFGELEKNWTGRKKDKKFCRLLFRLAEHYSYRNIVLAGMENDYPKRYLSALSPGNLPNELRVNDAVKVSCLKEAYWNDTIAQPDMICLGSDLNSNEESFVEQLIPDGFDRLRCVVMTDIHRNEKNSKIWDHLQQEGKVVMDMLWVGIIFFDAHLQKGHYSLRL